MRQFLVFTPWEKNPCICLANEELWVNNGKQLFHVRMGSKPSTTARVAKSSGEKNTEKKPADEPTDQKEQPQPKVSAEANPSKTEEASKTDEDEETQKTAMQQPQPKVSGEAKPSKTEETEEAQLQTISMKVPIKRTVTMTDQISFSDKDDDGRKRINQ